MIYSGLEYVVKLLDVQEKIYIQHTTLQLIPEEDWKSKHCVMNI